MPRIAPLAVLTLVALSLTAPEAFAQAGGGSSGFGGGGGGYSGGGGGASGGGGSSGGSADDEWNFWPILGFVLVIACLFLPPVLLKRRRARARAARDERVTTASAEATEDDPVFAAALVKSQAAALYGDIQLAWSLRDKAALERMLGADLLIEWRRRLADFSSRGWVNHVSIVGEPEVEYVGLVNRADVAGDRVTVVISATLHSVVQTSRGEIIPRNVDADGDGEIQVCEYWTLARSGDDWLLVSIEQEKEGAHHLGAPIVVAPWSDDARLADESLVELATADAPPAGTRISELVSIEFDGTAREHALDLALADPRCAPDMLEVAARRAVDSWAEAVDGDDAALLAIATEAAAQALLYPPTGTAQPTARIVVRGPRLLRLAIHALHVESEPPRMEVRAHLSGRRYIEDRDTVAVLSGSKDRETEFSEHWTFALDGPPDSPWRLVG